MCTTPPIPPPQSFNYDVPLYGTVDDYSSESKWIVTSAMAEGAIEGIPEDYMMNTPYETHFRFSKFN